MITVTPKKAVASRVHVYRDTISIGLTRSKCDLAAADTAIRKYVNLCQSIVPNFHVNFTANSVTHCVSYSGLSAGIDSACIQVCDTANICDTTYIYIDAITPAKRLRVDSVTLLQFSSKLYCPDTTDLQGGLVNKISFCVTNPVFTNVGLQLDSITHCVKVKGNTVGKDTACIIVCNTFGLCDTTTLYIKVVPDTVKAHSKVDSITIVIGRDSVYCSIDSGGIHGAIDSVFNNCSTSSGVHAGVTIDSVTHCLKLKGLAVGRDTACIIACNKLSKLCDTTKVYVIVKNSVVDTGGMRIKAVDDFDTTSQGRPVFVMVYANDTILRVTPNKLTIIRPPLKGTADTISVISGIIKYTPHFAACDLDSFRYKVCAGTLCDSAWVRIRIRCSDSLLVFNAVSPNGDGVNDVFVIEGLQKTPNHTLCIYDRWGNEVLKTTNYQSDWGGTWNGKLLPDGQYFYYIRNDDTNKVLKTGYLMLLR